MTEPGRPSFEQLRAVAYALLGDAADWLRSDWQGRLTPEQVVLTGWFRPGGLGFPGPSRLVVHGRYPMNARPCWLGHPGVEVLT